VIDLIDRPNEKPWGAGRADRSGGALRDRDGIFDATSVRLRSVPFVPDKVLRGV